MQARLREDAIDLKSFLEAVFVSPPTRVQGTHNRCFKNRQEILESLRRVFRDMQRHPEAISGYLRPFQ